MKFFRVNEQQIEQLIREALNKLTKTAQQSVTISISNLTKVDPKTWGKPLPKVVFSDVAYEKVQALVAACAYEVAWHYLVTRDIRTNIYTIHDVKVFPQIATAVTVESDDNLYNTWMDELPTEEYNNLKGHGHSHVNMGVFASPTDEAHYELLLQHEQEFYFMHVTNKAGQHYTRIIDIQDNVIYENADITVETPHNKYNDWAVATMAEFVKTPLTISPHKKSKKVQPSNYGNIDEDDFHPKSRWW